MIPAVRENRVRDQFHGPELFFLVCDERCVAVKDGRAVVVAVRVGRKRQDQPVYFACCHADGESLAVAAVAG